MARTTLDTLRGIVAKTPVAYAAARSLPFPFTGGADAEAQMRAMGSVGTLFGIVNRTSNATAQVDWHMHRRSPGSVCDLCDCTGVTLVTEHLALNIWRKPNDFMPRQEFVETFQQHLDLVGEAAWVIARNPALRSIPLELWPVRPDRIAPIPHPTDFISGYEYTSPDGRKVKLALDEVIQLKMPNPLDPYRGMGPVQAVLTDLDAVRYSAQWNRNFFINSAEPGGIIEVEKSLDDKEFDELSARWNEQHRGVANAHRVAIIEQGKWVNRTFTMRDMQFAELREVSSKVIREAFGFPKFALGDVDDVNRATADASRVWFAEYLTVPRLERIKAALNFDFLPMFGSTGKGVEFVYTSPVPEDREANNAERASKATAYAELVQAGVHPDDAALVVGLPPMRHVGIPARQGSPETVGAAA
jgi:HK97 family phage portal protein